MFWDLQEFFILTFSISLKYIHRSYRTSIQKWCLCQNKQIEKRPSSLRPEKNSLLYMAKFGNSFPLVSEYTRTFLRRRWLNNDMHSCRNIAYWASALPNCSVVLQYLSCTYQLDIFNSPWTILLVCPNRKFCVIRWNMLNE